VTLETLRPAAEANPFAEEVFNLKAEDLILDLKYMSAASLDDSFLTLSEDDDAVETVPAGAPSVLSEPEPVPARPEPPERVLPPLEPVAAAPAGQDMDYILEVARVYLGTLGPSLLKKEASPLSLQDRVWSEAQLRELVLRFCRSAQWIVGRQRSESLLEKIRERVRV
jgi:hypothetical protein